MFKCSKHPDTTRERRELPQGKEEWVCPICEADRLASFRSMFRTELPTQERG